LLIELDPAQKGTAQMGLGTKKEDGAEGEGRGVAW